jgi:hypothetical protein
MTRAVLANHRGRSGRAGQGGARSLGEARSQRATAGTVCASVDEPHTAQQLAWQSAQVGLHIRPQGAAEALVAPQTRAPALALASRRIS